MNSNLETILIVDDTETNIDILLELLGHKYDVLVALDANSAFKILEEEKENINLILLDIMMPNIDGFETCKILKNKASTKEIPIVFITAKADEDSIERAYDVGGDDYIIKPFKPRELLARVKTQLKLQSLIADLKFIASYDAMTGVYNRRKFFQLSIEKFEESRESLYVIMIDIDRFKNINDTYGHSVGDIVIKSVTYTISTNIPSDWIFGRIGGEEFAIVCSAKSQEDLIRAIEDIRELIEKSEVILEDESVVKFTISNGISKRDSSTKSIDSLLKEADKALYIAKENGRNRVIFR